MPRRVARKPPELFEQEGAEAAEVSVLGSPGFNRNALVMAANGQAGMARSCWAWNPCRSGDYNDVALSGAVLWEIWEA